MNTKSKSKKSKRNRKKYDFQNQIIKEKTKRIESLESEILSLNIDMQKKQELLESVDHLRVELQDIVQEMKDKEKEYDALIEDLRMMKTVFNREVFNGRWRIVRWLIK